MNRNVLWIRHRCFVLGLKTMQNRDISHFQSGMSDTERASKKKKCNWRTVPHAQSVCTDHYRVQILML